MRQISITAAAALSALFVFASPAPAAGDAGIAALQVGLRHAGLYHGTVDGVAGQATRNAVRRLQQRAGLAPDGVPSSSTRLALGRFGRHAPLGNRPLAIGSAGWDVASLQFRLAWHGFPSGTIDGHFGRSTDAALRGFQRWTGVAPDGRAGADTLAALQRPVPTSPITLLAPLDIAPTDRFGPRGARFHTGIDYPAASGVPVRAAGAGRVTWAGWLAGGWGKTVIVLHSGGVKTMYAHLSRVTVAKGAAVASGERVGLVGATGHATGPHLHFEVRVRGAAIDPLAALD